MQEATEVNDLAEGREAAFEALFDRLGARLFKVAWGILGKREDAEDVVQDVFVELVRNRARARGIQNLGSYLFVAVYRASVKRMKMPERRVALSSVVLAAPEPPKTEHSDGVRRAFQALPLEQREVITLKIDGGLTFEEIAGELRLGVGTAASRYRYGMEKLRVLLQGTQHGRS
jgi:RNA polymerase sigma-70 factor (ECF subfamily)